MDTSRGIYLDILAVSTMSDEERDHPLSRKIDMIALQNEAELHTAATMIAEIHYSFPLP